MQHSHLSTSCKLTQPDFFIVTLLYLSLSLTLPICYAVVFNPLLLILPASVCCWVLIALGMMTLGRVECDQQTLRQQV